MMNISMKWKRIVLSAAAAALLTGCAVGPDFTPPAAPETKGYVSENDTAGGQDIRMNADVKMPSRWWEEFKSADLNAVVDEAFSRSPDLKSAEATLKQVRENVAVTSGALSPQVDLAGTAGRQKYGVALFGPSDTMIPPFTYYELGPTLSYVLDYTGGLHRVVERDQALAEVQAYQRDAAYLEIAGAIANQAVTMAAARAEVKISQEIIAEDEKNVRLVKTSFDAGSGTRTDVLTAQTQLVNDKSALPAANQRLDVSRHALSVLAGHAPADWAPPEFALSDFHLPGELPVSLPSELVHQRPDIMAAEAQLHAASAAIGVATARLYPQITLSASTTQEALNPADLFKGAANAFSLAGNLLAPIFDGGTRRAERRAAIDAYQAAEANYEKVVLHAFGQVADILQGIRHDQEELKAQQESVKTAADSLKIARESYQAGNSGILQVVDAERQNSQAKLGLLHTKAQLFLDEVELYMAMGGGAI